MSISNSSADCNENVQPDDGDLSFLYQFVCDCPNPILARTIRALVDRWMSKPDAMPRMREMRMVREKLSSEDLIQISWLLAINPNTPPSVLDDLCAGAPDGLLERIAENSRTSSSTLAGLSYQAVAEIRIAAAGNKNTPIASIMILVNDDDADVRYSLAENHNIPREALDALCADDNAFVRLRAERTVERLDS